MLSHNIIIIFLSCFLLFVPFKDLKAQQKADSADTTTIQEEHSVTKATVFSAVLPGLGQAYNKKYWKIPIIYAAFGTLIYIAYNQNKDFKLYKNAYKNRLDGVYGKFANQSDSWLEKNMEITRRNRDLMFILTGVVYLLNIVDATVDAYLFDFNVSDDLSLNIRPDIQPMVYNNYTALGLNLTFNF